MKKHLRQTIRVRARGGSLFLTCLTATVLAGADPAMGSPTAGEVPNHRTMAPSLRQQAVSGRVTSSRDGSPIAGASVSAGSAATQTDANGGYSINVPPGGTLTFSYLGFATQSVPVDGRSTVNVVLQPGMADLDEVLVVGYGTQKKATKTGAVAQVSGEDLKAAPVTNVENTLAGRVPGVMAMNQGGEPGNDGSRILIRGRNTLNAEDAGPLVVIDGIPDRGGMGRLDPNDIESLTVLKDAAAAIYGSRSANGVILITTKRGKTGEPRISYTFGQGFTAPTKIMDMVDAATYAQLENEIDEYAGRSPKWTAADIEHFRSGDDRLSYPNTNWMKELLKSHSLQQKHSLSVRGGTEKAKYFASLGTTAQDGLYKNGATKYKQHNARVNLDAKAGQHLDLRFDLAGRLEDRKYPPGVGTAGNAWGISGGTWDIFQKALFGYPTYPARWPNGLPGLGMTGGSNPVVTATNELGYHNHDRWVLNGTVGGTLRIPGLKGLSLDGNFAVDKMLNFEKKWLKPYTLYNWDGLHNPNGTRDANGEPVLTPATFGGTAPQLEERFYQDQTITMNASVRYERSFGPHNLNLLAAAEQIEGTGDTFEGLRKYFLSEAVDQLFAGGDAERTITGIGYENARRNYFGRVSYNFDEKYLFDFNWRVDGSQKFPKEHRFGFFPGVGAGWVVSSENFWNVAFVNHLKVRGSYGKLGNDLVPNFQYLSTYGFLDRAGTPGYHGRWLGPVINNELYKALNQTRVPNPNIRWEVSENYNVGLELQMDGGKWNLEADYFINDRSNILTKRSASLPEYAGFVLPDENIGTSTNRGIEGVLSYRNTFGEVFLNLSANATYAKNKLTYWDEAPGAAAYQRSTGKTFGAPLYYDAIGIFRDQAHVDSYPHVSGARPGDIIFRDVNGDGKIDDLDRIRFDQSEFPTTFFGFMAAAEWRGFDISAMFQGAAGARQYIKTSSGLIASFPQLFVEDRWTADNLDAAWPRTSNRTEYWLTMDNTFWWWKTDYLRLKTLELGYTLPQRLTQRAGISSLRLFASGQNLFTLSATDLIDPEAPSGSGGVYYPQTKIYNLGLSVDF